MKSSMIQSSQSEVIIVNARFHVAAKKNINT